MPLTPCPICKADIDNDSIFCDQCGTELLQCPECHSFCRGKFCPKCGAATVKASELVSGNKPSPQGAGVSQTAPNPSQAMNPGQAMNTGPRPTTNPPYQSPGHTADTSTSIPSATPQPSRLVCRAMGITLPLQNGAIIGRVNGNYAAQLSACQYISGTHARLDFDGMQWTITDMGSRNGTAVNGIPCRPTERLTFGAVVRIASFYDFIVE